MADYKTKAAPITIDGVTFEAWHTGLLRYERRSLDGRAIVRDNGHHRSTYSASVDGKSLGRRFLSQRGAMIAVAKAVNSLERRTGD
jgi:hypothetical protein